MVGPTGKRAQLWHDVARLLDPGGYLEGPLAPSDEATWGRRYQLATAHFVAPSLYASVRARGRLSWLPEPVCAALAALYDLNAARNTRLRQVLRETVQVLNAAGIEPLLLKGSIALLPGQDPLFGARVMSDLDLALYNAEVEAAETALRSSGYHNAPNVRPEHYRAPFHHAAPLFHSSGDGYVELHRRVFCHHISAQALPMTALRAAAEPVHWDGLRLWVPCLEHQLIHNALHAQVADRGFSVGILELRRLLEFAQLRTRAQDRMIDWPRRLAALDRHGLGAPVCAQLLACRTLFGQPLPDGVKIGPSVRWAERRAWLLIAQPRLIPGARLLARLPNLPRRLITPRWYPEKLRYWYRLWQQARAERA
jgi:hypothetical protein